MEKKLNKAIYCLLLLAIFSCSSHLENEGQVDSGYVKKNISILNVNCDSTKKWYSEKSFFDRETVYSQIGISDSLVLNTEDNIKEINIQDQTKTHKINQVNVLVDEKVTWTIYYNDEFKELLFIEIKPENPFSIMYLSNKQDVQNIICSLVSDSNFVLNKLKSTQTIKFIPPH